jgi:hypothetical protein
MDECVLKLETLKHCKDSHACVTNRERRPGTLKKDKVIAKVSEFGSKCQGWMITRFHFKKGRTAAQTTPGVTAIFLGRNEVGNYAT